MPKEEEITKCRRQLDDILRENQAKIEYIFSVNSSVSLGHACKTNHPNNDQPNRKLHAKLAIESINQCVELAVDAKHALGNIISVLENETLSDKPAVHREDGEVSQRLWPTESQNALRIRNECAANEVQKVDCRNVDRLRNNAVRENVDARSATGNSSLHDCLDGGTIEEDFFLEDPHLTQSPEKQSSGYSFDSEDENMFDDDDENLMLELDEIEKSLCEDKSPINQIKQNMEIARADCPAPDVKYIEVLKTSFGFGKFRP